MVYSKHFVEIWHHVFPLPIFGQLLGKDEVAGSNPANSSSEKPQDIVVFLRILGYKPQRRKTGKIVANIFGVFTSVIDLWSEVENNNFRRRCRFARCVPLVKHIDRFLQILVCGGDVVDHRFDLLMSHEQPNVFRVFLQIHRLFFAIVKAEHVDFLRLWKTKKYHFSVCLSVQIEDFNKKKLLTPTKAKDYILQSFAFGDIM